MVATPLAVPPYRIEVRNKSLVRQGEFTRLTSLDLTPKFNDVGAFSIVLPKKDPKAQFIQEGYWLQFSSGDNQICAGQIRGIKEVYDANNPSGTYTAYGPLAEVVLSDRLAYPVPGNASSSQSAAVADVRSGIGETIIKQYVNLNAGPGTISVRQTFGLTIEADLARGVSVMGTARMVNLLQLIQPLAQAAGLGFRVLFNGDALQFQVFVPVDRSGTAKFGIDLGNLISYERTREAAQTNCAIAGDSGTGTARVYREVNDTASQSLWSNRTEAFVDQSGTNNTVQLDQAATSEVVTNGPVNGLAMKTVDTPRLRFNVDYGLGDTVSIPDASVTDILREIEISWTASEGPSTTSTAGTASTTGTDYERKRLAQLDAKLAALEATK